MKGQMVDFHSNGRTTKGYLAMPDRGKGLGSWSYKNGGDLFLTLRTWLTGLLAGGYVALAPDLYHGASTSSPDEAGRLMMGMKIDVAERDLADTFPTL